MKGEPERRVPDVGAVVVFGASGDLTQRKLFPALHNLYVEKAIPAETAIVGTARSTFTTDEFVAQMRDAVKQHSRIAPGAAWDEFASGVSYVPGDVSDPQTYVRLKQQLEKVDHERNTGGNRVWYMATLPRFFETIAQHIGKSGLLDTGGWHRLVVEKPFGHDLASARDLNTALSESFSEDQIFRIDHYLGKETVQNLLVLRFANSIFEPIWNRHYVDHVQITVAEDAGVAGRGSFYDQTGATRDVAQNHLLQLLALIAMEPPAAWDPDAIRDEKVQVLDAVRKWGLSDVDAVAARGQYEGYSDEDGVREASATETYVAMKLLIDDWRWAGVPFYLRTGKHLPSKTTEIAIHFQAVPHLMFARTSVEELEPNVLVIRIQPNEGMSLTFGTKVPGPEIRVRTVDMDFDYECDFGSGTPEAYERLLQDCMLGDATLFTRSDEIEHAWEIVDPLLSRWADGPGPAAYARGSAGPRAADELLARDGRRWRPIPAPRDT